MGYTQLWMGSDHLLLVRSLRVVERYKRFAFRDIEAVVITETSPSWILRALAILAAIGWGSIGFAVTSYGARGFFVLTAVWGLALVALDIARGPRRKCMLKTALTAEYLPPVSRKKIADAFIATVSQAVQSAQGAVTSEELAPSEPAPIHVQPSTPQPPPHDVPSNRGFLPELLFGLLLLDAVLVWVGIQASIPNATGLLPTIYLAELVLAGVLAFRHKSLGVLLTALAVMTLVLCLADISTASGVVAFKKIMNNTRIKEDAFPLNSFYLSQQNTAVAASSWRIVIGVVGVVKCLLDRMANPK